MKEKVVVFGTGDIARLAHFYFSHDSDYEIVAFSADRETITEDQYLGLPVVPFDEVVGAYPPADYRMFVAISYRNVNRIRADKYYAAKAVGYKLVSYVCSRSVFWPDLKIGDNCFIFENQTIQPYVEIGSNVVIWSGNHIGHDSVIGDHCFITSHVVISGHVTIEPMCFLGVNCTIRDGITIASESVVGAGATILKSTKAKGVYMPAKTKMMFKDSGTLGYFKNTAYKKQHTTGEASAGDAAND